MIRALLLAASFAALAIPANALSCMAPDIRRDFQRAAEAEENYIVVKGDLFFDEATLPTRDIQSQMDPNQPDDIPAWMDGHSLALDGFTRRFQRDVTLRVECLGPWCGGLAKGEHLAFLRQEGQQWVLQVSPCPGMVYANPTAAQERSVLACLRGETCLED